MRSQSASPRMRSTTIHLSVGARVLLVLGAVATAGLLGSGSSRIWLAAHWEDSSKPSDWFKAARLEPDNAAYQARIGVYVASARQDPGRAIPYLREATRLEPSSGEYWALLASAYEEAGQPGKAEGTYQRAIAAAPSSAPIRWRYGGFLLRRGDGPGAAAQIHRVLLEESDLAPAAISELTQAGVGPGQLLREVLPSTPEALEAAVHYFVGREQDSAALAAWGKLASLGGYLPLSRSFELIDRLIADDRIDDAVAVWRQAVATAAKKGERGGAGSLIFDGGFESDMTNGGFGWRQTPQPDATLDLVNDIAHGGARSARVVFDGATNINYSNLQQYVGVAPGRRYHFSAYMRTDAITTDSGPRFEIADLSRPEKLLGVTPPMTGTHPWTHVQADFTTGSSTHGVVVTLRRPPSQMFDDKIRGSVWVDDVSLTGVSRPGGGKP